MQTVELEAKELQAVEQEINPVLLQAGSLAVTNAEQYQGAADFLKQLKDAQKRVTDFFSPIKKKAHEAWKSITAKESEVLTPLKNAESTVKNKMLTYQRQEEEKRQAEQRRLQAEADARARKEQERLMKKAEQMKTPEKQEEYRQAAEEVQAPVVAVQSEAPKVAGISTRKTWKAEVTDKKAFVEAALKDDNLLAFLEIDMSKMNKLAAATKGQISYPGIKFFEETSMASRGA